jgi:iron complex outermembrane receptor protein
MFNFSPLLVRRHINRIIRPTILMALVLPLCPAYLYAEPNSVVDTTNTVAVPADVKEKSRSRRLEEVVVTANRREQSVQEIASGIKVLDGSYLERSGISGMEGYIFSMPGVDLADSGLEKKIAIRGVANTASNGVGGGGSSSPVGLYLNDTPIQGNGVMPDLGLFDLQRIGVLKGPQGTLYGEGAMGCTVRMILHEPNPDEFLGKIEIGQGRTRGGGDNYLQNLMLNVPITDEWALRIVGSSRNDSGFVDYFNRGTKGEDENSSKNITARVALGRSIGESTKLAFMLMHQDQHLNNFNSVQFRNGDLRNKDTEPQFANTVLDLLSLTIDVDLGFAKLTSSSSYYENERTSLSRFPFLDPVANAVTKPIAGQRLPLPSIGAENEWITTDNFQRAFAQEIRLVSDSPSWFNWVAGAFYRKRTNEFDFLIDNDKSDEPPPVGPGVVAEGGIEAFEQLALFGEVTLDLLESIELTLGVRGFEEDVSLAATAALRGPLYAAGVAACECIEGEGYAEFDIATSAITPKLTLSWFIDDDRMIYINIAEGVRSGGTNPIPASTTATPLFQPDSLWNYEIGTKTQWWDGRLTANLSLFRLEWEDMQVQTTETAQAGPVSTESVVVLNVARAVNEGAELELVLRPLEGLALNANGYISDGEIVEGDSKGKIDAGSPLPQQADISWSASAAYAAPNFTLLDLYPYLSVSTASTGERSFKRETNGRAPGMAAFQTWDVLGGLSNDRLNITIGVNNITDERNQIGSMVLEPDTKNIGGHEQ